jgi:putative N6-adenine-specific DNA methylase
MMARNIPPGLKRIFRIQSLPFHDHSLFDRVKEEMKSKIYPSGKYHISGGDMDAEMIEKAQRNAERAGVLEDIEFSV